MKLNVTGRLFLKSIKTYWLKDIEKNQHQILHFNLIKYLLETIYLKKIIKSCKATNLEFLKLKEKLGLCLYKYICDEQEFILMSEKSSIQHDVENKQLKEENEKLRKENENEKLETRNEKIQTRNDKWEQTILKK